MILPEVYQDILKALIAINVRTILDHEEFYLWTCLMFLVGLTIVQGYYSQKHASDELGSVEISDTVHVQKQTLGRHSKLEVFQYISSDDEESDADNSCSDSAVVEMTPEERQKYLTKRREELENIAEEVEKWASHLLFEEGVEEDGWREVKCSTFWGNFNREGKSKCFLKWMPDSRGKYADFGDDKVYPCVRCYTTIDAPLEHVCAYLSDETNIAEYNDFVVKHNDLEEISPHSKICWGQCPQIFFIKPRDFVTFCHHRWKNDGTQVVVHQAVDHKDAPAVLEEGKSNACRAYALRGANFLSRDPNDPNKTRFAMLIHANPGGNLPLWASKTCANALAPIEPFKLFYRIEKGVKQMQMKELSMPINTPLEYAKRSTQAGGLSLFGYACFWPNGGGLIDETDNKEEKKDN